MSYAVAYKLHLEILEALGIDPKDAREVTVHVAVDEAVTVTVKRLAKETTMQRLLGWFKAGKDERYTLCEKK